MLASGLTMTETALEILRVGLAQIDARLGDVEPTSSTTSSGSRRARAEGVELLLFPELSLTGYRLLHLTPRVALQPATLGRRSPGCAEAAPDMAVVVGCVEEDEHGLLYNSALLLPGGAIAHTHRKLYLPTYGIFQEGRFFDEGRSVSTWRGCLRQPVRRPDLRGLLALRAGASGWRAPARSCSAWSRPRPAASAPTPMPPSQEAWESLTRASALLNTAWIVYCGRVGWEEGTFYTGGSHIVRPGGELAGARPLPRTSTCWSPSSTCARSTACAGGCRSWRAERSDIEGPE